MIRRQPTTRRAFTLLELTLVVLLLALLAALALPRLFTGQSRQFNLSVDQLGDLLTMYAQRDALGDKPVAIWNNAERGRIELLVMDQDPARPEEPADWRADRFVTPVVLPRGITVSEARVDGDVLGDPAWSIISTPGQDRPLIELTLQSEGRWTTLVLAPSSVAPRRVDAANPGRTIRASIDLDATGRNRENW